MDQEIADEIQKLRDREERDWRIAEARIKARDIRLHAVDPFGGRSEHSWVRDKVSQTLPGGDHLAKERIHRSHAAAEERGRDVFVAAAERVNRARHPSDNYYGGSGGTGPELRAVSSTTLGGLIPATLPPDLVEQIAFGLRSSAPLSMVPSRVLLGRRRPGPRVPSIRGTRVRAVTVVSSVASPGGGVSDTATTLGERPVASFSPRSSRYGCA